MKKKLKTKRILRYSLKTKLLALLFLFSLFIVEANSNISTITGIQDVTVTGQVTDQDGNPLPGASVVEKGSSNGTQTDFDGNFVLEVSGPDAILIVSYIGFASSEQLVNVQAKMNITLQEEIGGLDEVVVVGYGSQSKKELASAVVQTTGDVILQSPTLAISNSLAGRLPGVVINQRSGEPGRDAADILIRGAATTGSNAPLIVIDGVQDRDGLSRLDPNDIETLTVLKDASAAIYGSRSSGGVILITTKRGVSGKPIVNYSMNTGIVKATRLPEFADAASYAQALNDYESYFGRDPIYSQEDINLFANGSDPIGHPNTDWWGETFSGSAMQNRHNLSVRGGSDNVKYFLSLGKTFQDDLLQSKNTYYKQYNFRSNIDATVTKNLTVSLDIAGRQEDRKWYGVNPGSLFFWLGRQRPTEPYRWPNGSLPAGIEGTHPQAVLNESGYYKTDNQVFNGTLSFTYNIPNVEGLNIRGFFAVDKFTTFNKDFETPWYYYDYDRDNDTYTRRKTGQRAIISLRERHTQQQSLTSNLRIHYDRTFNDHSVSGMLGYEHNETNGDSFEAYGRNFDTDAVDQLFAGSSAAEDQLVTGSGYESGRQSLFGRTLYTFKSKYIAQFSFRYDGSINFPKGDRFGFFPAVSGAWRISEEPFMEKIAFLDNLKLRASYGIRGNDRIVDSNGNPLDFVYLSNYSFGTGYNFQGQSVTGVVPSGEPIANITWEKHKTLNLGIDIGVFNNKLKLEADVFHTKTSDILGIPQNTTPLYAGFTPPSQNIGKMENKGFEIATTYQSKIGDDIQYNLGANFAFARNKVIYIDEGEREEEYQKAEGHPLNSSLIFDAIGIYRSQTDLDTFPSLAGTAIGDLIYRDVNNDGRITDADRIRIDRTNIPEITFGFNLGLKYKNFDLNGLFQGQANSVQRVFSRLSAGNVAKAALEDYYTPNNPDARNPRLDVENNRRESTFWLRDSWFVRLKTIELGYTLPKDVISKIGLQQTRLYVSGSNLFTVDNIDLFDPETTSESGSTYPLTKVFNLGINVSF